jgi:hypothetical protein
MVKLNVFTCCAVTDHHPLLSIHLHHSYDSTVDCCNTVKPNYQPPVFVHGVVLLQYQTLLANSLWMCLSKQTFLIEPTERDLTFHRHHCHNVTTVIPVTTVSLSPRDHCHPIATVIVTAVTTMSLSPLSPCNKCHRGDRGDV